MKKTSFILGLIAGILGIIVGIVSLIKGMIMPATEPYISEVILIAIAGIVFAIAGLVASCLGEKRKVISGIIMILSFVIFIPVGILSVFADNILTFVGGFVVSILFLVAGIFTFCIKVEKDNDSIHIS